MRAASTAAFLALSTPTVATGTPGGIWTIESSASRPSSTRHRGAERNADHRQLGVRGDDAGKCRRQPGAADQHLRPRSAAVRAYSETASGVRCADRTSNSHGIPFSRRARRARPACGPGPTRSRPGCRPGAQPWAAPPRCRSCAPPSKRSSRRPPRTRSGARGDGRPVPVTDRIRPPFVTRARAHRRAAVEDEGAGGLRRRDPAISAPAWSLRAG